MKTLFIISIAIFCTKVVAQESYENSKLEYFLTKNRDSACIFIEKNLAKIESSLILTHKYKLIENVKKDTTVYPLTLDFFRKNCKNEELVEIELMLGNYKKVIHSKTNDKQKAKAYDSLNLYKEALIFYSKIKVPDYDLYKIRGAQIFEKICCELSQAEKTQYFLIYERNTSAEFKKSFFETYQFKELKKAKRSFKKRVKWGKTKSYRLCSVYSHYHTLQKATSQKVAFYFFILNLV